MRKTKSGFTIIELLIVIVVIGILAAITITAFTGIQARADTASRMSELKAWEKLIGVYVAINGQYPGTPDNADYCLGTGFPVTDGGASLGNCRDLYWGPTRGIVNPALNAQLATVGSLPRGIRTLPSNSDNSLGPYGNHAASGEYFLHNVFKGSTCPAGTVNPYVYPGGKSVICEIRLLPIN